MTQRKMKKCNEEMQFFFSVHQKQTGFSLPSRGWVKIDGCAGSADKAVKIVLGLHLYINHPG
jgi:hypothetical protein